MPPFIAGDSYTTAIYCQQVVSDPLSRLGAQGDKGHPMVAGWSKRSVRLRDCTNEISSFGRQGRWQAQPWDQASRIALGVQ
jgi:hypothetical protein